MRFALRVWGSTDLLQIAWELLLSQRVVFMRFNEYSIIFLRGREPENICSVLLANDGIHESESVSCKIYNTRRVHESNRANDYGVIFMNYWVLSVSDCMK